MDRSLAIFAGGRVSVMAFRWFSKVILLGSATGIAAACSSDEPARAGLAAGCSLNSDCNEGLVCGLGKCHLACKTSADCTEGVCVKANGVNVCQLPKETECKYTSFCPEPLVCAVDSKCRNACAGDRDCLYGQKCAASGVCAESTEVDPSGNIVGVDAGMGSGGKGNGGATGSGGGSGSGGLADASAGGMSGSGGAGGAPDASATGGAAGTGGSATGGTTGSGGSEGGPVCSGGTGGSGPTPPACTSAGSGISVSGLVVYPGTRTGRLYVMAADANGSGDNLVAGTSMTLSPAGSPYNFVIQGMPRQNVNLRISAYIDTGNDTLPHTSADPIGTASASLGTTNLTGVAINLNDPPPTPPAPPQPAIQFGPGDGSVIALMKLPTDSNGHMTTDHIEIYWDTSPGVGPSQKLGMTTAPTEFAFIPGLTNGTPYYFAARYVAGTVAGPLSAEYAVTPIARVGGHSVTGNISFSCGGLTAASTVTVVLATDNGGGIFSSTAARTSPQPYGAQGVPDGIYNFVASVDVDGNSAFSTGDESTGFDLPGPVVEVKGGNVTGPDLVVPSTDAIAAVSTLNDASNGYELKFGVESNRKRVVSASVCSGPRMATPSDLPLRRFSAPGRFRSSFGIGSNPPAVGDTFGISLAYDDGSTGIIGVRVTGVLPNTPVLVSPTGNTGSTPTFSWTLPSGLPAKYWQEISVSPQGGGDLWRGAVGAGVATVMYNADGKASQSTLASGNYNWNVDIRDENGNSASAGASFTVP